MIFKVIGSILRLWSYLCTVPWAPGGSKFTRNPTPPEGVTNMINYLIRYSMCSTFSFHPPLLAVLFGDGMELFSQFLFVGFVCYMHLHHICGCYNLDTRSMISFSCLVAKLDSLNIVLHSLWFSFQKKEHCPSLCHIWDASIISICKLNMVDLYVIGPGRC
jgi:hypothetical protein